MQSASDLIYVTIFDFCFNENSYLISLLLSSACSTCHLIYLNKVDLLKLKTFWIPPALPFVWVILRSSKLSNVVLCT